MDMHFHAQPPSYAPPVFNYPQDNGMSYVNSQYTLHPEFPNLQYMYSYPQSRNHLIDRNVLADPKTESKPRLSKEEVEKLEKVFQENPKPSSSTKAQLADSLNLERPRINNWFQNRRAKAKQERKQEEYEARRAAEKTSTEPVSPDESLSSRASEPTGENARRRTQPSSALFPDLSSTQEATDGCSDNEDEDEEVDDGLAGSDGSESSPAQDNSNPIHADAAEGFPSPLAFGLGNPEMADLGHANQNYSHSDTVENYAYMLSHPSNEHVSRNEQPTGLTNSVSSPNEHCATGEQPSCQYSTGIDASFSTPFLQSQPAFGMHGMDQTCDGESDVMSGRQTAMLQGILTPTDSFKSPPPPANIASRRNIPRPAALQTNAMRSRSFNLGGGYKTSLDGSKRVDPSSPASAIRRITSTTGNAHGRIQKSSSGSRSPMFFNRNPDALLNYHARSPVGAMTATFTGPGAAPPTPMTPAVVDQQGNREPTVSSSCSDDGSFALNSCLPASIMQEIKTDVNLKTPPSTPGLLTHFGGGGQNFNAHAFGNGYDLTNTDAPSFTPFLQTDFPDLAMRNIPSYVEVNDPSPTTPLYSGMMGSIHEQNAYVQNTMGNTQFDWDANESVNSSRSSPNQSRSKQIQFTQNMTPQDYTSHQER